MRLAFEQNEPQAACVFLGRVLGEVPESAVELRNQLSYYTPRCAAVDTTHVGQAAPDSAAIADSVKAAQATAKAAAKAKGKYTLQVAAYATRAEADKLAKRLKDRGLDVRVVGTAKLYRVRIGRYETRTAAAAAQKELKTKNKIDAFVTEATNEDR